MRKIITIAVATVSVVSFTVMAAQANHCRNTQQQQTHCYYWAEDQDKQNPTFERIENFVSYKWGVTGQSVKWYAPTTAGLRQQVVLAMPQWTSQVSYLTWFQVDDQNKGTEDVEFRSQKCPLQPGWQDCIAVWDFFADPIRDASYMERAIIYIRPYEGGVFERSESVRRGAINHELGHWYGLHERYYAERYNPNIERSECNEDTPDEETIMDAFFKILNTVRWEHCDYREGPVSSTDIVKHGDFWQRGELANIERYLSGLQITYQWKDKAWSEERHNLYFEQLDPDTGWQKYADTYYDTEIGVHHNTQDRTHSYSITIPDHLRGRDHRMCGAPYFLVWRAESTPRVCSQPVYVPGR